MTGAMKWGCHFMQRFNGSENKLNNPLIISHFVQHWSAFGGHPPIPPLDGARITDASEKRITDGDNYRIID